MRYLKELCSTTLAFVVVDVARRGLIAAERGGERRQAGSALCHLDDAVERELNDLARALRWSLFELRAEERAEIARALRAEARQRAREGQKLLEPYEELARTLEKIGAMNDEPSVSIALSAQAGA